MKLKEIVKTATIRQTAITLFATGINGVMAVVFYLILARVIGSSEYGIFTLATTTIVILCTVFELGMDRASVKFLSKYRGDIQAGLQINRLILTLKLIVGSAVALITLFFARPLALLLFHNSDLSSVLPLIGLGLLSQMLFNFVFYYMQANEKFIWWGTLLAGSNLLRLILTLTFFLFGKLDAYLATALWALVPFASFLLGLIAIDRRIFLVKGYWSRLPEIVKFNKWVTSFTVVSAVGSRLDTYVTAQLVALSSVGVYGLGTQAVAYLPQIIVALGAVTTPKFASFSDAAHNHKYVRKASLLSLGIAVIAVMVMIPGGFILFYLSGRQYDGGLIPYLILLLSMLIFLVTSPIRDSLLYFHNKPQFFFWAGIGQGIITVIMGILLIPRLGLLGSALSNLSGQLLLAVAAIWLFLNLNTGKNGKPVSV